MPQLSTIVDSKSTTVVCNNQQMLSNQKMAMGKRIIERLTELGWKQTDLCARAPDIEPQALNALIKRDSKTSKFAPQIAAAIGCNLQYLLTGEGEKLLAKESPPKFDYMTRDKEGLYVVAEVKLSREADDLVELIRKLDLMKSIPESTFASINMLLSSLEHGGYSTPPENNRSGLIPEANANLAKKAAPPPVKDDTADQN